MESSILNAIGIDPGIIIIIVLVAILFLFMYMIKVSMSMSRFMKKYKIFMRGQDGISLERSFINKFNQLDTLSENSKNHMEEIRKIKEVQNITLNKVAIVKYDAFKEMGGKLSFTLALLDENNNGFLMNSVHSSDGCYSYTKRVKNGDSEIALSNEEKVAIERAMKGTASNPDAE